MAARYRRVNQGEGEGGEEETKKVNAERAERISAKIHALVWVIVAGVIAYLTDVPSLMYSDKLNRWALNLAVLLFFCNIGIFLYLAVWLPYVMKITAPWDVYCPNMIPTATGLGVTSLILAMIAFWPVWGMLSPLFIVILAIGLLFSAHFIPWPC